ncbi:MAG: type II toxin-antitoxin system VapC family toxin [Chloroflexota bacterium]
MIALAYADASALVKLVVDEPESAALLRWFLEAEHVATSRIGVIETIRASERRSHDRGHRDRVVEDLVVIEVDQAIARMASSMQPPELRTLDTIHLATALRLLPDLAAFVTYDDRQAAAARRIGLPVIRPA